MYPQKKNKLINKFFLQLNIFDSMEIKFMPINISKKKNKKL